MTKILGVFLVLFLAISFVFAQQIPQDYEEAKELAEKYGVNESQFEELAEEYQNNETVREMIKENDSINISKALNLAQEYEIEEINSIANNYLEEFGCSSLEIYKGEFIGQEIPENIPYKNEVINLYVSNGSLGNIVIEEGKIVDFNCEENVNHTYDIIIKDFSVAVDFAEGFDIEILLEKLDSKEIVVEGIGFNKKIKWFFSKIAMKWFF